MASRTTALALLLALALAASAAAAASPSTSAIIMAAAAAGDVASAGARDAHDDGDKLYWPFQRPLQLYDYDALMAAIINATSSTQQRPHSPSSMAADEGHHAPPPAALDAINEMDYMTPSGDNNGTSDGALLQCALPPDYYHVRPLLPSQQDIGDKLTAGGVNSTGAPPQCPLPVGYDAALPAANDSAVHGREHHLAPGANATSDNALQCALPAGFYLPPPALCLYYYDYDRLATAIRSMPSSSMQRPHSPVAAEEHYVPPPAALHAKQDYTTPSGNNNGTGYALQCAPPPGYHYHAQPPLAQDGDNLTAAGADATASECRLDQVDVPPPLAMVHPMPPSLSGSSITGSLLSSMANSTAAGAPALTAGLYVLAGGSGQGRHARYGWPSRSAAGFSVGPPPLPPPRPLAAWAFGRSGQLQGLWCAASSTAC